MLKNLKNVILIIGLALSTCHAAQIQIKGVEQVYTYNADINRSNCPQWHSGATILRVDDLQNHLANTLIREHPNNEKAQTRQSRTDCIKELARILLAQIPSGTYNVVDNKNKKYIAGNIDSKNDIYKSCSYLKKHLIDHGHLGYFPMYSHDDHDGASGQLIARGVFNVDLTIMNRINSSQRQIYKDFTDFLAGHTTNFHHPCLEQSIDATNMHLFPNMISGVGYKVDPYVSTNQHPNLEDAVNGLINELLSTTYSDLIYIPRLKTEAERCE